MSRFARFLEWFRSALKPVPAPAPPPTPGIPFESQVRPLEPFSATNLAALHNAERARAGLAPLLLDTRLSAYAVTRAARAAAMNLTREHLHDGFNPPTVQFTAGENAEIGSADAAGAMAVWMNSSGHRDNILHPQFSRMGAGRAISVDKVCYWYCVFAG